jgi:hypothetical protein
LPIAEICTPVARVMIRLASFASLMGCDWRGWVKLHAGTMQRAEEVMDVQAEGLRAMLASSGHRWMKMLRALCDADACTARPGIAYSV